MDEKDNRRTNKGIHQSDTDETRTSWEDIEMAKKKKTQTIGTISGMEILRQTRPPQDIPFRTGSYTDKRKKREKINKNRLDKWL